MRSLLATLAVVLGATALSACSEQGDGAGASAADSTTPAASGASDSPSGSPSGAPSAGGSASGSATATASGTPEPVMVDGLPVPAGVELTPEGTQLQLGGKAQVVFRAESGTVAALRLRVDKVQLTDWRTSFEQWRPPSDDVTPYFVRARVTNIGDSGLGGVATPLYLRAAGLLYEPTSFAAEFKACSPRRFPDEFKPGAGVDVCLVYLVPEGAEAGAVVFRPTAKDEAITWAGDVENIVKDPEEGEGDDDGED